MGGVKWGGIEYRSHVGGARVRSNQKKENQK
jgi:hypothetical protein